MEENVKKDTHALSPFVSVYIGEGKGSPLQHSCLENSLDRGA